MTPMTAQVQQRTRMGLMFDTIRIPMPIIRPVAIPQPAEMTMQMPMATAAMMPIMQMPVMPMAAGPNMGGNFALGGTQPSLGGSMTIQGSMSAQQAALLMMLAEGQLPPQLQSLVMSLIVSGQLTPQQITDLINRLTPQRGASAAPTNPESSPTAVAATPAKAATAGSEATPQRAAAPSPAALEEQLRVAEQRLKSLEESRHAASK